MYKIDKSKKNVKLVNAGNIEGLRCSTKKGKTTIVSSELKANYAKKQACNFIIDITNSEMMMDEAIKRIKTIYTNQKRNWVEKIILKKGDFTKVYVKEKTD